MLFLIEAENYSAHQLTKLMLARYGKERIVQDGRLISTTVGRALNRPVVVVFSPYYIDDEHTIIFYESTSDLVDWTMITAWLAERFTRKWRGDLATTNAENFHHCLHAIDEAIKAKETADEPTSS